MEDLTVFDFDDLFWNESRNIHTALIHDFDDTALIIDITEGHLNGVLIYHPSVNYKNTIYELTSTTHLNLARQWAWSLYRTLIGHSEPPSQVPAPLDNIYIVTGCIDGIDELELLP